jgi:16S rRNA (guanine(966)-N(2))-methyltransferase RsmD
MDRMRESIFALLGEISGRSFLDLFSGSGVIALEAASRGAEPVTAVEMDPLKRKTLLENTTLSPVRIHCRFMAVELYVKRAKEAFDIIFCDPPFPYRYKWDLAGKIAVSPLMGSDSLLLFHRPREDPPPAEIAGLLRGNSREYGRSIVEFFTVDTGIS